MGVVLPWRSVSQAFSLLYSHGFVHVFFICHKFGFVDVSWWKAAIDILLLQQLSVLPSKCTFRKNYCAVHLSSHWNSSPAPIRYRQGYSHNNSINLGTNSFSVVPRSIFSVELIFAWDIFVSCIFNEIICIFAKNSNFSYFPA